MQREKGTTNRRASQYGSTIPALQSIREPLAYCRAIDSRAPGGSRRSSAKKHSPVDHGYRSYPVTIVKYLTTCRGCQRDWLTGTPVRNTRPTCPASGKRASGAVMSAWQHRAIHGRQGMSPVRAAGDPGVRNARPPRSDSHGLPFSGQTTSATVPSPSWDGTDPFACPLLAWAI